MTNNEILQADVLDILFEQRNKAYGAYQLRKTYPQRMLLATGLTALLVSGVLFIALQQGAKSIGLVTETPGPVMVSEVDFTPPPELPQEPKVPVAPAQNAAIEHYTSEIEIVPDVLLQENDFPPVEALAVSGIGTFEVSGPEMAGAQQPSIGTVPNATTQPEPPAEAEIWENNSVDQMATFPGGAGAFQRFLSRQLAEPEGLEPGKVKTVKVQFVIEKDGSVSGFNILQSGGEELDNMVFKALRKAPRWKPAVHRGRAVAVIFTQPVTFIGAEE